MYTKVKAALALPILVVLLEVGCNQPNPMGESTSSSVTSSASKVGRDEAAIQTPVPAFKVTHQESGLVTIVVDKQASDLQLERLIWQLRTAVSDGTFNKMGISQTLINERDPTIFFQIYRGSRCAAENRSKGSILCSGGPHMHDAANFLLGSFKSRDSQVATLYHGEDETRAEQLFGAAIPPPATFSELVSTKRPFDGEEEHLSRPEEVIQRFNQSVWAGGRKALFESGTNPHDMVVTGDWLVLPDNLKLMLMGLKLHKSEACSAGFTKVRLRPFARDTGSVLSLGCTT